MKLRSSHLANQGARLAGSSASRAVSQASPAGAPAGRDNGGQSALRASPETLRGAAAPRAREASSQAPAPGASRAFSDAGRERPASEAKFELTLSDTVQAILHLAANAAGVSHGEFVARAICAYAEEAVGFPRLSDELHAAPVPAREGGSRFDSFNSGGHGHRGVPP